MTKKLLLIFAIAIFALTSCNSGGGDGSSEDIVKQFITFIGENNYEAAFDLQKKDSWSNVESLSNSEEFGNIDGIEIIRVVQQDDKDGMAVVFAEVTYQNAAIGDQTKMQNFYLKKFGGNWKIVNIEPSTGENIINENSEDNTNTENENNSNINWDGKYTYEDNPGTTADGTPIWSYYEMNIDGEKCTIVAQGYQLNINIKCYGEKKGNSYEVYFEENIESMFDYKKGQLLFTLKNENGKIITYDNKFLYEDKAKELFVKETTKEQAIQDIRNKFKIVNDELKSYVKDVREIEGSEGGEAILYLKNNEEIRKIELIGLGSMGRTTRHYYFWDNAPFFVYTIEEYYDEPMGNVIEKIENRYYIYNNELIKWLDNNKKEVAITKFAEKEAELSGHITELIRLFF